MFTSTSSTPIYVLNYNRLKYSFIICTYSYGSYNKETHQIYKMFILKIYGMMKLYLSKHLMIILNINLTAHITIKIHFKLGLVL
jgi:hypothetical protein